MSSFSRQNVAVAASTTTSNTITIPPGQVLVGLYIDPGMTSTTVTFQAAPSGGSPAGIIDSGAGAAYSQSFVAGHYLPLSPLIFAGVDQIAFIFGSSEAAARNCIAVCAPASGMI